MKKKKNKTIGIYKGYLIKNDKVFESSKLFHYKKDLIKWFTNSYSKIISGEGDKRKPDKEVIYSFRNYFNVEYDCTNKKGQKERYRWEWYKIIDLKENYD